MNLEHDSDKPLRDLGQEGRVTVNQQFAQTFE